MTITGTSHFVSLQAAHRYYALQNEGWDNVTEKIEKGEIHIGPPTAKPGERVIILGDGYRYAITEGTL